MNWTIAAILLLLIITANGAPVVGSLLFGNRFNHPIDDHRSLSDGYPILGNSKTWRGLIMSLALTIAAALLLGMNWTLGAAIAAGAMAGDLLSSFIKRRMGLKSSSMALGLDQVPEALFPLLLTMPVTGLGWRETALLALLFLVLELVLSRILYQLHLRKHPY